MPVPTFTFGLAQADLENAISIATVLALYDDGNGLVNQTALAANIVRGEQELLSFLVGEYGASGVPSDLANDPFLKSSALDFVTGFSVARRPEYSKQQGLGTKDSYFEMAKERALRIVAATQRATTVSEKPANVGGPVAEGGRRMYIPDASGRTNSGDF
jgi:hypothetical protein